VSVRSLLPASRGFDSAAYDAPARPTPPLAYALALVAAVLVGAVVSSPKFAVVAVALVLLCLGVRSVLARPVNGFLFAFVVFPFYTLFRALATVFTLPIPLTILGVWPELVLSVMFTALVIQAIRKRERLPITWHDLPVAFFFLSLVYGFVISVVQRDYVGAVYGFHMSASSLFFYFVARWLPVGEKDLARVLRVSFTAFAVLCLLSLVDYFTRTRFMIGVNVAARPDFGQPFDPYDFYSWYPRLQSLLYAEQLFGTMCAGVCVFCIAALMPGRGRKRIRAWSPIPLLALSFACLLLTMSRGGYICFAVALVLMCFLFRGRHRAFVAVAAVFVGVLVFAGVQTFGDDPRVQSVVKRTTALGDSKNTNAYDRMGQWRIALENFPLYPAGIGLGRGGASAIFHGVGESDKTIADGGIFKILSEQGAVGVLIFMLSAVGVAYTLLRAAHQSTGLSQTVAVALFCWYGGLLVQNIAGNVFDMFYVIPFFWMMTGFVVLRPRQPALKGDAPPAAAVATAHE